MENLNAQQEPDNKKEFEITDDSPALLCTVNDNIEVASLESLLRCYDIPVMKKWHNAGDIAMLYMAVSFFGADIFVPSKLLDKAKGLLADGSLDKIPDYSIEQNEKDSAEFAQAKQKQEKTMRGRALIILFILFVLPILLGLAMAVFNLTGLI